MIEEIRDVGQLVQDLPRRRLRRIIMHHFWSPSADDWEPGGDTLRAVDDYHRRQGWGGIGYHYTIGPDDSVWRCRPLRRVGAHTRRYNQGSIGVAYASNFGSKAHDRNQPHDLPLACGYDAGVDTVAQLVIQCGLTTDAVHFHNEYANKTCPGDEWALAPDERVLDLDSFRADVMAAMNTEVLPSGRPVRVKVDDEVLEGLGAVLEDQGPHANSVTVLRQKLEHAMGLTIVGEHRLLLREALRQAGVSIPPPTGTSVYGGWHPEQVPPTVYAYTTGEAN